MSSRSRAATIAGVLYLTTEVSAMAGLLLYQPALDADYLTGGGADTRVALGAVCELILIVANLGTIAVLYPVVKRYGESVALGAVCGRLLEAAMIAVGMLSVLTMVTLRQDGPAAGTDTDSLVAVGQSLVAFHDWTFLVGPSIFLGIYSLLLAYLMYRSQLVPRAIAWLGLIGGPLVTGSALLVVLGVYGPTTHAVSAIPVFAWEVSLGIYLIAKGFRPTPTTPAGSPPSALPEPMPVG